MSVYRICITRDDGRRAYLRPGSMGERDLVEAVVAATVAQGVGIFRSEARVADAVRTAFDEVLYDMKAEVIPLHSDR